MTPSTGNFIVEGLFLLTFIVGFISSPSSPLVVGDKFMDCERRERPHG